VPQERAFTTFKFQPLHQAWAHPKIRRVMIVRKSCMNTKKHHKQTSIWNC